MSHDTTTPEIRPESTYRFVSVSTIEKRIRRFLAKQSQTLIHTKQGTAARLELGEYAVYDSRLGGIVIQDTDLSTLARGLGVIADTEVVDMGHAGWTWTVCRVDTVTLPDGRRTTYHEPLTRDYTTEAAARQAAAAIGGEGVAVIGFAPLEDRS